MTNAALAVASSTLNPWIVAARAAAIDVIDQALSLSSRVIEDAAVPTSTMGALIPIVSEMPHGGFKESGYGKDMSIYALEHYTELKHVMIRH